LETVAIVDKVLLGPKFCVNTSSGFLVLFISGSESASPLPSETDGGGAETPSSRVPASWFMPGADN
jgi:hypothetical protein